MWTLELESPPTAAQQALIRRKVTEYSHLHCAADVEIEWRGNIGALRLLGGLTRDTQALHERRRQANHRSELLLEHLHTTYGRLEDGSIHAHLVAFHWHRPFYHAWVLSCLAPMTYPFELFACWLAAPLTALIAIAVVRVMRNEPTFAGVVDVIALLPAALLHSTRRKKSPEERRRVMVLVKAGIAAFIEGMHYWHTVLFVYEIYRSLHPDFETVLQTVSLALLVMPAALLIISLFVVSAQYIEPETRKRHPLCVALVVLLAALHIELFALLPWRARSWAGYPSRGVLLWVIVLLLLQKLSMLVLSIYFIGVEPSTFGLYVLIFSAVSMAQVLIEKLLLLAASRPGASSLTRAMVSTDSIVPAVSFERRGEQGVGTPSTLLPESLDRVLLTTRVKRLHPMLRPAQQWILHSPGVLRAMAAEDSEMRITKGRLYIEQAAAAGATDANGLLEQWPLATLVGVTRRRHELRHTALELTMAAQLGAQGSVLLLSFNSHDDRERVVQTLLSQRPHLCPPDERLQEMTEKWHEGEIDNYTYLLHLNECASRSFSDLSQYPIMCAIARSSLSQTPLLC